MSNSLIFLKAVFISLLLSSCASLIPNKRVQQAPPIKNIIVFIGDGMGPQQVGLLLSYARQAPHSFLKTEPTAFDKLFATGDFGLSLTYPATNLVTDSAASASQLATGKMALIETLGLDAQGNNTPNLLETARQLGKTTALISDTRITHATPAGFAAHLGHRDLENQIAEQLLNSQADILLSAGWAYWLPANMTTLPLNERQYWQQRMATQQLVSKRKDNINLLTKAEQNGYQLVFTQNQLQQAKHKVLGLFASEQMQDAIAEHTNLDKTAKQQPSLADMSIKALTIANENPQGFFAMIEAGQIDWAGHHNDAGLLLHEMLRANETLTALLNWLNNREDTLLIVTADHETGGFGFSYSSNNRPNTQKLSNGMDYKPSFNFGSLDILDKLYAQRCSYHDLFKQFDALPKAQQTPLALMNLVNTNNAFHINENQAAVILSSEDNRYYAANHETLNVKTVPKIANSAFFPYVKTNRENLLAQALGIEQQTVWATGAHTSTPVYVLTNHKNSGIALNKILHHTQLSQLIKQVLLTGQ